MTSNEESHTPEESSSGNRVLQSPKVGQDSQTGNNVSHPNSQELMSNTEHSSEVANLESKICSMGMIYVYIFACNSYSP